MENEGHGEWYSLKEDSPAGMEDSSGHQRGLPCGAVVVTASTATTPKIGVASQPQSPATERAVRSPRLDWIGGRQNETPIP